MTCSLEDSSGVIKRSYSEITDEITKFIDDRLKKVRIVELSIPGWYSCPGKTSSLVRYFANCNIYVFTLGYLTF